ncbi:MAG: hypothetical protein V1837_01375 [Candidatus Woesearchaeota archaeon]
MKRPNTNLLLYWSPRILAIMFIIFISLIALDSFGASGTFWQKTGNFVVHLIPSFILIAVLAISWKHELAGAAIFILFGLAYISMMRNFPVLVYIMISGPAIAIGVLFLANWYKRMN